MNKLFQLSLLGIMLLFSIHTTASVYFNNHIDSSEWYNSDFEEGIHLSQSLKDGILKKLVKWIFVDPFNRSYGKYRENNSIRTHPYTTFSGDNNFIQMLQLRNQILNSINNGQGYKKMWVDIYSKAQESYSTDCGTDYKEPCPNAVIAKCAAFVYLIGLNSAGTAMMNEADRNSYKDKAVHILRNLDTDGKRFRGNLRQMERSFELICYLQAYDYIAYKDQEGDGNIEEKLHKFTYELYSHANNYITLNLESWDDFWNDPGAGSLRRYNNQSILAASAIGMAAIVLNNRGAFFWARQRKPDRWAGSSREQELIRHLPEITTTYRLIYLNKQQTIIVNSKYIM
jgi:hypothetical protein